MFNKIFGSKKVEMVDTALFWKKDVSIEDMVLDLELLGRLIAKPKAFENGCRIVTVRESSGGRYYIAELYVDKFTMEAIEKMHEDKNGFKAVAIIGYKSAA